MPFKGLTRTIAITPPKHLKTFVVQKTEVSRWLKKFRSGCKNLDDQVSFELNFNPILQVKKLNLVSSTWRVSGEFSILLSNFGLVSLFNGISAFLGH